MKKLNPKADREFRLVRRKRCAEYIRRSTTLEGARALGARDRFYANTSAWITALGDVLSEKSGHDFTQFYALRKIGREK